MQYIVKKILSIKKILTIGIFLPFTISAAEYTLLEPLESPSGTPITNSSNLAEYLQFIFQFAIGITGVLAVIMIILGGITYLSTDAVSGKKDGKEMITNALWGLALAILSWLILYTINPTLLNIKITP